MVGDNEQVPTQKAENKEKEKKEGFRRVQLERELKEKEQEQKSCLDEEQWDEIKLFSSFTSKRTQKEAHHEGRQKKRDPLIEVSIKSLEGDDHDDLSNDGGEAHHSKRNKEE